MLIEHWLLGLEQLYQMVLLSQLVQIIHIHLIMNNLRLLQGTDAVMLYGGRGNNDFIFSNSGNYLDGEWRHLLVRKKGNNVQLYINADYVGSTATHTYSSGASNTQNIMIGR